jgi:hypothetical protein
MFGAVETDANPVPFGETGDRTEVNTTAIGFAVGAAVAGARVGGACVASACVAGAAIAAATVGDAVLGAGDAAAGAALAGAESKGVGTTVAAACATGAIPALLVAASPHAVSANKTAQIATEKRFPKSHPSLNSTLGS